MELTPSAHTDTFTRDHLPPPDAWPTLLRDPPAPSYPDRLNCAVELLAESDGRRAADRVALRGAGGQRWTYGELRARVDQLAHALTDDLGVRPGNRVLLRGPTSPWLAACWLAVLKAGAVAVTVLASQRHQELATICELARVRHAVCAADRLDHLERAAVPGLRIAAYESSAPDDLLRLAAARPAAYEAVPTAADDVALIAFTSGTTGRPKGCLPFHRDVLAVADTFSARVLRPRPDDVFAGSPPLGFTFGLGGLVIFPLRAGASAFLDAWAGPAKLLRDIAAHRVSVLFTAPTAYRAMLGRLAEYDVSSLRRYVSAGENLPAALWHAWHAATRLRLINGIGGTELLHIFIAAADDAIRPGTTGVPVPGFEARVVDGEPGALAVRGPTGCRYLADERQREYVRDGWNLTGDTYVREPDGYFRFVARTDDMIVSAPYNIAGPEVEEALSRHPDVVEAAVTGRPDEARGAVVIAHVVLRPGAPPGPDAAAALREFARAELAPYKCPREFRFLPALPGTPTGKLQQYRLREGG